MKVYELLTINKELLQRIDIAGIKPEDYKYLDLYNEYTWRLAGGEKVTYIVAKLADKYRISERKDYNVFGKFWSEINSC
ncbi:MAG: hypothetical protein LUF68_08720, partial [Clostridiales bacterium]|nr:hypothetical protein [Clostridiales bacterium]